MACEVVRKLVYNNKDSQTDTGKKARCPGSQGNKETEILQYDEDDSSSNNRSQIITAA